MLRLPNLCRVLGLLAIVVVLALPRVAVADALDDEMRSIAKELQCPVCENVTVADSNSPLAQQMREMIKQKLAAGETREQILEYFVDRYGPGILSRPQPSGLGLVAWWMPVAGLLLGAGILILFFTRGRAPVTVQAPNADLEAEVGEVLRELEAGRKGDTG